jgi:hypothetical protein
MASVCSRVYFSVGKEAKNHLCRRRTASKRVKSTVSDGCGGNRGDNKVKALLGAAARENISAHRGHFAHDQPARMGPVCLSERTRTHASSLHCRRRRLRWQQVEWRTPRWSTKPGRCPPYQASRPAHGRRPHLPTWCLAKGLPVLAVGDSFTLKAKNKAYAVKLLPVLRPGHHAARCDRPVTANTPATGHKSPFQ